MVRWWTFRNILLSLLATALCTLSRPLYGASAVSGVTKAQVLGAKEIGIQVEKRWLSDAYSAVAEFTFHENRAFDARAFTVSLGGSLARIVRGEEANYSRWENRKGTWVLIVSLGEMPFETAFLKKALEACKGKRALRLALNGSLRIKAAQVYFIARPAKAAGPVAVTIAKFIRKFGAPVQITAVTPDESPTSRADMQVKFAPLKRTLFSYTQCRLDGGAYQYCTSPVQYRNLASGAHKFEVRQVWGLLRWWWASAPDSYAWTVRNESPVAQWVSTPAALVGTPDARFEFTASPASGFECRLDGGSSQACESPYLLSGLTDGSHALEVVAVRDGGARSVPIEHRWVIDTRAPVASLNGFSPAQSVTNQTTLQASFGADESATFACAVDGGAFSTCTSPFAAEDLVDGAHSFAVRAVDAAGNVGEAVSATWEVDTVSPRVSLQMTSPLQLPSNQTSAQFAFAADEAASFLCRLDEGEEEQCADGWSVSGLSDGSHSVSVASVDVAGNRGESAQVQWLVDTQAPVISLVSMFPPEAVSAAATFELAFEVSESATVACDIDGAGPQVCQSPVVGNALADGFHSVVVSAVDAADNRAQSLRVDWRVALPAYVSLTSAAPSAAITRDTTASFTFVSAQSTAFECALDGVFAGCVSPANYSGLADGAHTFEVRALNSVGEAGPVASHAWSVDTLAPSVGIDAAQPAAAVTDQTEMTLSFSSPESASFVCSLDGGAEEACESPKTWSGLADGNHVVSVAAVDTLGNRSALATHSWEVRTVPLNIASVAVQQITRSSAVIRWTTNLPAHGQVIFGLGSAFDETTAFVMPDANAQSFTLTGLRANSAYQAKVRVEDAAGRTVVSGTLSFSTLR